MGPRTSQPNPLDLPPPHTRSQAALRAQLADLVAQALEISSRLNALSLPASLPPEILSEIFLVHAARIQKEQVDSLLGDEGCCSKARSYYKWIYVAHNAERNCERCTTWFHPSHTIAHLTRLLPRIKHLVLIIEGHWGTADLLNSLQYQAAVSLETLRIGLRGDAWVYHTSEPGSELTLRDGLFASVTPRLQSLTTSFVDLKWSNSLFCPSLRHLDITGVTNDSRPDTDTGTLAGLISTLATLPLLETLALSHLPAMAQPADAVADLPRLRLLRIRAEMGAAALLLSHMRFPPSTAVSLSGLEWHRHADAASLGALQNALSGVLRDTSVHTVAWTVPSGTQPPDVHGGVKMRLEAWADVRASPEALCASSSSSSAYPDAAPRLELHPASAPQLVALLRGVPFPRLAAVHLAGGADAFLRVPWADAFRRAPDVVLVRATGSVAYSLGGQLGRAAGVPLSDDEAVGKEEWEQGEGEGSVSSRVGPGAVVMPRLRTLQIHNAAFPPSRDGVGSAEDVVDSTGDDDEADAYLRDGGEIGQGVCERTKEMGISSLVRGLRRRRALGPQDMERIEFACCESLHPSRLRPLLEEGLAVIHDGNVLEQ
ncbi:hypothetical protein C8Q77DRAFT_1153639 [Trametes polyzona]|nr:hypothetical protein C8Q77DRAFT_1153639 [Trametes polyzona]